MIRDIHVAIAGAIAKSITEPASATRADPRATRAVAEHNVRARLQAMPAVTPVQGGWAATMTWQF